MSFYTREELSPTVVCLIQDIGEGKSEIGTGSLIVTENRFYLVTAAHVAKNMRLSGGFILSDEDDKPVKIDWSQVTRIHGASIPWVYHNEADLAVLLINPSEELFKKHFKKRFVPINVFSPEKKAPSRDILLTSVGFPLGLGVGGEYLSPLTFESKASSGFITLPRADTQTPCTFYILEKPSVGGYSGCAVYDTSVHKFGSITTTGDGTKCYGFMHGTISDKTGGKLAMVTPSYYLFDLIDLCKKIENSLLHPLKRNEPCYCDSGKRFKECHGRL